MKFDNYIKENTRTDHQLAKKVFNKFPSSQKRVINKLRKEFDKLEYDDSPSTLMSRQYGTLSPNEHHIIDKAQNVALSVLNNDDKLLQILNPTGKYKQYEPKDEFIMNLWGLW